MSIPGLRKAVFDATHVYSAAAEASRKRLIDEQIMEGDFSNANRIDLHSEDYLKALIHTASSGKLSVGARAKRLQFYIVRGGGEGFLDPYYKGRDASRDIRTDEGTTSGGSGTVMIFDSNDLIAVFDAAGTLVGSALLDRPISITHPNIWSEHTANRLYEAWDGQLVSLYRNEYFFKYGGIKYYGLTVMDKLGWYASGKVRVDLHKQEETNGCIFIQDPNTPDLSQRDALNHFEPQLITDIQHHLGARTKSHIGIMHMVHV